MLIVCSPVGVLHRTVSLKTAIGPLLVIININALPDRLISQRRETHLRQEGGLDFDYARGPHPSLHPQMPTPALKQEWTNFIPTRFVQEYPYHPS